MLTVLGLNETQELRREVVAKLAEGLMELLSIDRARVVPVEVTIYVLPVLDILPQPGKLVETNRSTAIGILRGQSRIMRTLSVTSNGKLTKIVMRSFTVSRSNAIWSHRVSRPNHTIPDEFTHDSSLR